MHNGMRKALLGASIATLAMALSTQAFAQQRRFDIPAQDAATAVTAFGLQADLQISAPTGQLRGVKTPAIRGEMDARAALKILLAGTGLVVAQDDGRTIVLQIAPQSSGAVGDGAEVEALIVTAQKREEDIQDVPIAISAFTAEALEAQKIEGGFDLLKAIPNVTFSKNNFTSYNFSIRGVGTKAISATTDPGVAVAFNSTALIQNRLFEQEYFDIERVEVLRGPQGTLYGRNATSGVINVISAKPDLDEFGGWLKGEVGNYDTKRISAMINVPLVEDKLAIRLAAAMTERQGYDFNSITNNAVNGRDLWSARMTIGFEPTERIRGDFIWERFEEDDNRSRTGKQLCHRDPGKTEINGILVSGGMDSEYARVLAPALFSQGCMPGNLYDDAAFSTPNGLALPFVFGLLALGTDCGPGCTGGQLALGSDKDGNAQTFIQLADPYGGKMQSRDLRTIASFRDPVYRANTDVVEINVSVDLMEGVTVTSQTAYVDDLLYSFQDFNRFNTGPIFTDTDQLTSRTDNTAPSWWNVAPGGVFCDPQLGCSDTLAGFDISKAEGRQFSQELRLQSDFPGRFNFNVGANFTRFKTEIDYYVFYNLITGYAMTYPFNGGATNPGPNPLKPAPDIGKCWIGGQFGTVQGPIDIDDPRALCPYIDPNPIESINGEGHNYFRSKNPYKLTSAAAFGEVYWSVDDFVKITAGLRYTDDRKTFIPHPSQVLLAPGILAGGVVNRGYPAKAAIEQHWGEWSGRLGVDWKPDLGITDDTLLYAFYSRGYKGGGANPPSLGLATMDDILRQAAIEGMDPELVEFYLGFWEVPVLQLSAVEYGPTFEPEFVNAFELGSKNSLLGGGMTLNATAFLYDYADYQVSQIRDRTAVNENFDAAVWGAELETMFAPNPNLQVVFNVGYLDTQIADGESSIDIMNRTQGDPGYVVVKPWVQLPSNCVIPLHVVQSWMESRTVAPLGSYQNLCTPVGGILGFGLEPPLDPENGNTLYDPRNYPEINGGAGLRDELGGNELPNAPHWTVSLGAQYGVDFLEGWRATVRGDAYWQSQSWARVYNSDPYDKLHGWYNVNLSVWIERPDDNLKIELYAKNLLDKTPITDAFLNSDDTALTTNVFVLDPRLIGLSIRKGF